MEAVKVLNKMRSSLTIKELQELMIDWWFIWFFRNKICFDEESINLQNVAMIIINYYLGLTPYSEEM